MINHKQSTKEQTMNNEELIKQIAKNSRHIVEEADAQNVTTEDEVEQIVINLLSDRVALKYISAMAIEKADDLLFEQYHSRGYSFHREKVAKLFKADLSLLTEDGADYGPLSCCVLDGFGEDTWKDVESAVEKGLIDNWGHTILSYAEDEYERIHDES